HQGSRQVVRLCRWRAVVEEIVDLEGIQESGGCDAVLRHAHVYYDPAGRVGRYLVEIGRIGGIVLYQQRHGLAADRIYRGPRIRYQRRSAAGIELQVVFPTRPQSGDGIVDRARTTIDTEVVVFELDGIRVDTAVVAGLRTLVIGIPPGRVREADAHCRLRSIRSLQVIQNGARHVVPRCAHGITVLHAYIDVLVRVHLRDGQRQRLRREGAQRIGDREV